MAIEGAGQFSTAVFRFRRIAFGLLAAALMLAGCSALRLGYDNGDTLALAYLDSQLDLDHDQKAYARRALHALFAWHRRHELPAYVRQLATMRAALDREVSGEDIGQLRAFVRAGVDRTVDHALPELVAFARLLRPEQLAHLQKKFDESNRDYRAKFLEGTAQEQHERRVDRILEQMERWLGGFSDRQRVQISEWVAAVPYDGELRYRERLERQRELFVLIRAFRQPDITPDTARRLAMEYANRYDERPVVRGAVEQAQAREAGLELVAQIVNHSTTKQKAQARKRLQGWIDDLGALIAKGAA